MRHARPPGLARSDPGGGQSPARRRSSWLRELLLRGGHPRNGLFKPFLKPRILVSLRLRKVVGRRRFPWLMDGEDPPPTLAANQIQRDEVVRVVRRLSLLVGRRNDDGVVAFFVSLIDVPLVRT